MAWLVEDQYLRRGLRLKSVSTAFQQLAEMPSSRDSVRMADKDVPKLLMNSSLLFINDNFVNQLSD
ncbi:hypothetical protein [Lactiplantibacillus plantarum]|uniref:hypothetical protein n=1 Tax=Lactiplantibacillus plantarum TaxID=1590 RepID=UPI0012B6A71F